MYPTIYYPYQVIAQGVSSDYLNQAYEDGYAAGQASNAPNGGAATVAQRDQFASEVNDIATKIQKGVSVELEEALNKPGFLFPVDVARSGLPDTGGPACNLLPGDLLSKVTAPTATEPALMKIVATKGNCTAGQNIQVSVEDLSDMLSALSGHVDENLQKLDTQHGDQAPVNNPAP